MTTEPCPICGAPFPAGPSIRAHKRHCAKRAKASAPPVFSRVTQLEPGGFPLVQNRPGEPVEVLEDLLRELGKNWASWETRDGLLLVAPVLKDRSAGLPPLPDTRGKVYFIELAKARKANQEHA